MEELLPLENRTELEILHSMLTHLHGLGMNISEAEIQEALEGRFNSNQYIMDLDAHAYIISELEEKIVEVDNNTQLSTAMGEKLDNLGTLRGIPRIPGGPALVDIVCSENLSSRNITVPAGTRVLLDEIASAGVEYVTVEEVTVLSGTGSTVIPARSVDEYYLPALPVGCVTGLSGFVDLVCSNPSAGSCGRDIESDDDYRVRLGAPIRYFAGSRMLLEDYLASYDGLDSYRLVPMYDGVGTLKIVCDTLPSLLEQISDDVYENCMLVTDYPPLCVLPESTTLSTIELTVTRGDAVTGYTDDELRQLIVAQVETFVNGGVKRDSTRVRGMGIGDDFVPSQLVQYLLGEFPELTNIVPDSMEVVSVPDTNHFNIEEITVVIE
jgi:hypothetical protein